MYVEQLLEFFSDTALAHLEQSTRIGTLVYASYQSCMLAHHQLGYQECKASFYPLALNAEQEFCNFGPLPRIAGTENLNDVERRQRLLPLIMAEKQRRMVPEPPPEPEPEPEPRPAAEELVEVMA